MGLDHQYEKVGEGEDVKDQLLGNNVPKRTPWWKSSLYVFAAAGGILAAALIIALCSVIIESNHAPATTTQSAASSSASLASTKTAAAALASETAIKTDEEKSPYDLGDKILYCGSNAEEARSLGCVYDVMMQLWMPEPCYDGILTERFLADGNWTWWADPSADRIMSDEEMRKGEHTVAYMLQDYHRAHCIFAWEKLVRAMRNQQPIITELISYDHVIHCRHKTLSKEANDGHVRGVRAPTGFTGCAMYDTWKTHLPANSHSSTD